MGSKDILEHKFDEPLLGMQVVYFMLVLQSACNMCFIFLLYMSGTVKRSLVCYDQ